VRQTGYLATVDPASSKIVSTLSWRLTRDGRPPLDTMKHPVWPIPAIVFLARVAPLVPGVSPSSSTPPLDLSGPVSRPPKFRIRQTHFAPTMPFSPARQSKSLEARVRARFKASPCRCRASARLSHCPAQLPSFRIQPELGENFFSLRAGPSREEISPRPGSCRLPGSRV